MKYTLKTSLFLWLGLGIAPFCGAQETTSEDNTTVKTDTLSSAAEISNFQAVQKDSILQVSDTLLASTQKVKDSVPFKKFKIDGVAAVVGERLILESDIQKMYLDLKSQGISTAGITDCKLAERLLKDKLYAHQAIQDSIVVSNDMVNNKVDQQIAYFVSQTGTMEKLLEFYNMETESELRAKLFEINKEQELALQMQTKIIEEIEITPEEVRQFFDNIQENELPRFGDEVEIAQITIEPEVPDEEIKKVIDKLNEFRKEILSGESSFATKAVLYSDDPGSSSRGGKITLTRDAPFVQEFKDAAFSQDEGEISKPFKTEFGYHILMVDEIRGQQVDVRHILLIPERTDETIQKAKEKIDSIRQLIVDKKITFDKAARRYSDQKETRQDGGQLINPTTGDTRFDLAKIDPNIYGQVANLKENEISTVLTDTDRTGNVFFKIVTVTEKYPAHTANYAQDFEKIKALALKEKKLDAIKEWQTEKIKDTYIKINGKYRECDFLANWLKN
ncbi:MAG TPA: peptidylprolyl isomerase [Flavobacteriaceae bacterium]|nr:peptidylprolyl isomerase [Flavobacteriaceae bacterium]